MSHGLSIATIVAEGEVRVSREERINEATENILFYLKTAGKACEDAAKEYSRVILGELWVGTRYATRQEWEDDLILRATELKVIPISTLYRYLRGSSFLIEANKVLKESGSEIVLDADTIGNNLKMDAIIKGARATGFRFRREIPEESRPLIPKLAELIVNASKEAITRFPEDRPASRELTSMAEKGDTITWKGLKHQAEWHNGDLFLNWIDASYPDDDERRCVEGYVHEPSAIVLKELESIGFVIQTP